MSRLVVLVILLLVIALPAMAGGVIRPGATLGPKALGMAGAYNAVANDGSSFYHNVAGLTQIDNDFVQLNADLLFPRFEFDSQESEFSLFPMPELAGAVRLSDKLVLGSGIYAPYGIGVTYSDGPFQESLLAAADTTLSLSYQLTDTLSIGIGGDIGYGQLIYNSSLHQIGDVVIKPLFLETEGDGFGFGFRTGVLWHPADWFSWGLSYSSPMRIDLSGKTGIQLFGIDLGTDKFDASVSFPARWGTGVALRPANDWLVALDVNYFDYRQTDHIDFDFKLLPTIQQRMDWQSNWSAHVGVEHQLDQYWTVRAGVGWMQHAVPKTTANPIIPDGDGWCVGLGIGYQKNDWSVDIAYLHAWAEREVERSPDHLSPGDYKAEVDVLSVGFTYHFKARGGNRQPPAEPVV